MIEIETMHVWSWRSQGTYDGLKRETWPRPQPAPGAVLLRIRASSISQRDVMTGRGTLPANVAIGVIPLCVGAKDIVEVGAGVPTMAVGARAFCIFNERWQAGPLRPAYFGGTRCSDQDGMLAQ